METDTTGGPRSQEGISPGEGEGEEGARRGGEYLWKKRLAQRTGGNRVKRIKVGGRSTQRI